MLLCKLGDKKEGGAPLEQRGVISYTAAYTPQPGWGSACLPLTESLLENTGRSLAALRSMEVTKGEDLSAEQAASLLRTPELESQRTNPEREKKNHCKIITGVRLIELYIGYL